MHACVVLPQRKTGEYPAVGCALFLVVGLRGLKHVLFFPPVRKGFILKYDGGHQKVVLVLKWKKILFLSFNNKKKKDLPNLQTYKALPY